MSSAAPAKLVSRRGFLGSLGLAGAAGATLTPAWASPLPAAGADSSGLEGRLAECYAHRLELADRMVGVGMPEHANNGDESQFPNGVANFTKGLPHGARGEVDANAWQQLRGALSSGRPEDFEGVPMGGARKLVNPQAGLAFDSEGNDPQQFTQLPAPKLTSAEAAGEMVELYWMALLRDVPFEEYHTSSVAHAAVAELNRMSDFRGPRAGGPVTLRTLFRDKVAGFREGPYVSQFLWMPTPFGAEYVERRMRTLEPGSDHLTTAEDWLAAQNGSVPGQAHHAPLRRYIVTGRDLAEWVHIDVLFQAYFNACLILGTPPNSDPSAGGIGCPVNPGNPYVDSVTQEGFGTWGPPGFKSLLCEVASRALKAVWYQKWFVHRRLRPEAFGGRVHYESAGLATYGLHPDVLDSQALAWVQSATGNGFLPQTFPEGSPIHPSYGAGHATVAGACVTILKALFDENFVIPNPVIPSADGSVLLPYQGADLTVRGELNKLASNVATGRNIGGVHWRSDALESLRLGEQVAISVLRDHKASLHESGTFRFTLFGGQPIEV